MIVPCSEIFFSQCFSKRASYGAIPERKTKETNPFLACSKKKALSRSRHAVSSNKTCSFSSDMFLAAYHVLKRMLSRGRMKYWGECYQKKQKKQIKWEWEKDLRGIVRTIINMKTIETLELKLHKYT